MRYLRAILPMAIVCLTMSVRPLAGQDATPPRVDRLMTRQELRATGVSKLSAAQRAALSRWIARYTQRAVARELAAAGGGGDQPRSVPPPVPRDAPPSDADVRQRLDDIRDQLSPNASDAAAQKALAELTDIAPRIHNRVDAMRAQLYRVDAYIILSQLPQACSVLRSARDRPATATQQAQIATYNNSLKCW